MQGFDAILTTKNSSPARNPDHGPETWVDPGPTGNFTLSKENLKKDLYFDEHRSTMVKREQRLLIRHGHPSIHKEESIRDQDRTI